MNPVTINHLTTDDLLTIINLLAGMGAFNEPLTLFVIKELLHREIIDRDVYDGAVYSFRSGDDRWYRGNEWFDTISKIGYQPDPRTEALIELLILGELIDSRREE